MIKKPLKLALQIIGSILLAITITIAATLPNSYAQETLLPVAAWIFNGQLWVSNDNGDTRLLDEGYVLQATLSPNQSLIAAIVNQEINQTDSIEVIDIATGDTLLTFGSETLATSNERLGFSRPIWVNDSAIWFNTIELFEGPPGFENRYDIYQLDLDGSITEQFGVGTGGTMMLSPDRKKIAISRAGEYQNQYQPSVIQIFEIATQNNLSDPFEFPAVATGSEISWSPAIQWNNESSMIAFAIPTPDLIYAQADLPITQICLLSIDAASICSDEQMGYPAQPVWNTDLTRVAYQQQILSSENFNSRAIVFGEYDEMGTANLVILDPIDNLPQPILWLDDGTLLFQETFTPPPNLYSVGLQDQEIQGWQPNGQIILNFQQLNETTLLLATGDYANTTISIYDLQQDTLHDLGTFADGFIDFVEH